MRIIIYCLLAMLWPAMNSYAQSPSSNIRFLSIGDTVPDIEFDNVINYPVSKIHLSDFRQELVILDFWSSSCSSCLELFPHLQQLQNHFTGKLQIMLVNGKSRLYKDTESKIHDILLRYRNRTGDLDLPVIFDCTSLDDWFPWRVIPHEVWIRFGKVIAITSAESVNEVNIQAVVDGKQANLPLKSDEMIDLHTQSLSDLARKPLYASIVVEGSIDGLNGLGVIHDTVDPALYTGWYLVNQPLFQIYRAVFEEQMTSPMNRVVFDFYNRQLIRWFRDNTLFSYQVSVPPLARPALLKYLEQDLTSKFHITFKTEKKLRNCYVLKSNPESDIPFSKGGESKWVVDDLDRHKYIRNYALDLILENFNALSSLPLLNETGISAKLDLDIPYEKLTEQTMIASFRKAGFSVTLEPREINVLIMTDQNL